MKVLITGANGFIGSHLCAYYAARGFSVVACSRRPQALSAHSRPGCTEVLVSLGSKPDPSLFEAVDIVFHCAHDFSPDGDSRNRDGTVELYQLAHAQKVQKQVFFSSFSAHQDAISGYGKVKFELERFFLQHQQWVVRPGLVIGNGGMFGRNVQQILSRRLLPIIDGGSGVIPVISIQDLLASVDQAVTRFPPGAYNLFNPDLVPLRTLMKTVMTVANHHAWLVSVPYKAALSALTLLKHLHIPSPISIDSLKGLKMNDACPHQSDLLTLLPQPSSLEEMIRATVGPALN